jgi:DNA-binding response OmpR family regulator
MDVLVVDDDPMARGLVARFVMRAGHRVVAQAEDGLAALALIGRAMPDVIITDCQMPNLDGIGMARRIRATGNETRIVMLSGQSERAVIDLAFAAGVDAYLIKPMDPGQLIAAIGEVSAASKPAA